MFKTIQFKDVFPEHFGFFLMSPKKLSTFHDFGIEGKNLLEIYSNSDLGDKVTEEGIIIPLLEVEADYYDIIIHDKAEASYIEDTKRAFSSQGWIFFSTGELIFSSISLLLKWDSDHPKLCNANLPKGWYEVSIYGGLVKETPTFEFVFTKSDKKPQYNGNLNELNLRGVGVYKVKEL